ncbi:hypothetical protein EVAR_97679_1 [Eumeta japonica]|uniref:Uncharacterized protein n=1 Tax=Eumeta variegata TaxID=151549 RepID=A0A4C1WWQ0_EUMVA|nr:hypothetical protein EVAR_97679_1 [Eumeta japonica]
MSIPYVEINFIAYYFMRARRAKTKAKEIDKTAVERPGAEAALTHDGEARVGDDTESPWLRKRRNGTKLARGGEEGKVWESTCALHHSQAVQSGRVSATLSPTRLQREKGPSRPTRCPTLTVYRREVAASTVVFHPHIPFSIQYPTPSQENDNAPVTFLVLRVSVGSSDHLLSSG